MGIQAELTKERDELAEKVANAPAAAGTNEEWTAEKATLTAARDRALAEIKVRSPAFNTEAHDCLR